MRPTKGLVLSGGAGTRLRPLTYTQAKQLVPIANKPVLFYGIEALAAADIADIGIIVAPETAADIARTAGDGSNFGVKLTYITQEAPRGLADAVLSARDFLDRHPFVVYLGDNILRSGINEPVYEFRLRQPDSLILLTPVEHPEEYGVAELESGNVVRLSEKPTVPNTNLALVGIYMFGPAIFDAACAISPSKRGELEITDAIQRLIDTGYSVEARIVDGWWKDTGRVEDILDANRLVLDDVATALEGEIIESDLRGRIAVARGAKIERSVVRGPTVIGQDSLVVDSYVGPFTSIGESVQILGSEVEHSILLAGSSVHHLSGRLDGSLIGRDASITNGARRPDAYRFVIGDQSSVVIP